MHDFMERVQVFFTLQRNLVRNGIRLMQTTEPLTQVCMTERSNLYRWQL